MTYLEAKEIMDEMEKIPYPELRNIPKNPTYATMLYHDLSGSFGELTAITQYIYEHFSIEFLDISKIMKSVAIVEMHHLDILGMLIKQLGKNPYFITSNGNPWNSTFINYHTGNLISTMEYNINAEEKAIEGYKQILMKTTRPDFQQLFNRIILDEQSHIKIFSKILKDIKNY